MRGLVTGIGNNSTFANVLVGDAEGDAALGADELDEVDDLGLVSLRVAVGERVGDVVRSDSFLGGEDEGGLGVVVSLDHSVGSHDLDSLIVAVLGVAMQVDGSRNTRGELEKQDYGVVVIHLLDLLEPSLARGVDLNGVLADQPAVNVDVMRAAVVEDTSGFRREGQCRVRGRR